jgi:hypothetical protein
MVASMLPNRAEHTSLPALLGSLGSPVTSALPHHTCDTSLGAAGSTSRKHATFSAAFRNQAAGQSLAKWVCRMHAGTASCAACQHGP